MTLVFREGGGKGVRIVFLAEIVRGVFDQVDCARGPGDVWETQRHSIKSRFRWEAKQRLAKRWKSKGSLCSILMIRLEIQKLAPSSTVSARLNDTKSPLSDTHTHRVWVPLQNSIKVPPLSPLCQVLMWWYLSRHRLNSLSCILETASGHFTESWSVFS